MPLRGVPPNAFFAHWSLLRHYRRMVGLSDPQLKIVMTAANAVPVERRSVFLERVGAMLKPRGRFSDDDVRQVAALAMASSEFLAADFSGSLPPERVGCGSKTAMPLRGKQRGPHRGRRQ
ncbi:MAG: hypothetical protein WA445_17090 [Pseudolabrys sp.]